MKTTKDILRFCHETDELLPLVIIDPNGRPALVTDIIKDGAILRLVVNKNFTIDCPHCSETSDSDRCTFMSMGMRCSKKVGHHGPHISCGRFEHAMHTWPSGDLLPIVPIVP